jgi:hypothetical protein
MKELLWNLDKLTQLSTAWNNVSWDRNSWTWKLLGGWRDDGSAASKHHNHMLLAASNRVVISVCFFFSTCLKLIAALFWKQRRCCTFCIVILIHLHKNIEKKSKPVLFAPSDIVLPEKSLESVEYKGMSTWTWLASNTHEKYHSAPN